MQKEILAAIACLLMSGCATVASLPESAEQVDFNIVGQSNAGHWHDGAVYEATFDEVIRAALAAMSANGYELVTESRENRVIKGRRSMTFQTWASVVAIYYRERAPAKTEVHVIGLSTKDKNILAGDATLPIPPRILASIASYLSRLE